MNTSGCFVGRVWLPPSLLSLHYYTLGLSLSLCSICSLICMYFVMPVLCSVCALLCLYFVQPLLCSVCALFCLDFFCLHFVMPVLCSVCASLCLCFNFATTLLCLYFVLSVLCPVCTLFCLSLSSARKVSDCCLNGYRKCWDFSPSSQLSYLRFLYYCSGGGVGNPDLSIPESWGAMTYINTEDGRRLGLLLGGRTVKPVEAAVRNSHLTIIKK